MVSPSLLAAQHWRITACPPGAKACRQEQQSDGQQSGKQGVFSAEMREEEKEERQQQI
jgi:hypothetical protein